jgi:hypothetical protein
LGAGKDTAPSQPAGAGHGVAALIAFITHSADIRQILEHIGVDCEVEQRFLRADIN